MKTKEFFATLALAAEQTMARRYTPDCCIAATRIAIDVLEAFGVVAVPVPVAMWAFNPQAASAVLASNRDPSAPFVMPHSFPPGSMCVEIGTARVGDGFTEDGRKWNGHLVAAVPDAGIVLDLSASQATRPQHGLRLEALVLDMPPHAVAAFVAGETMFFGAIDNCAVVYAPRVDNVSYVEAVDWQRKIRHAPAAIAIIAALTEAGCRVASPAD